MTLSVKQAANRILPASALQQMRTWRMHGQIMKSKLSTRPGQQQPHGLPGRLLLSLTSYPPRFGRLHVTLESLLRQSVAPDEIVLWIARDDLQFLPRRVRQMEGVTIRSCDDVRSYKKLVFALEQYPDAFIATADDDIFFEANWLEQLVRGYDPAEPTINCVRAHRLRMDSGGHILPYNGWDWRVRDSRARRPAIDIMPTGGAGALYSPGSLHPDVTNRQLFQELCPTGDDLWFYWMGRRAGSRYKVVADGYRLLSWPQPEDQTLAAVNLTGGNDRQIKALDERFGNPLQMS